MLEWHSLLTNNGTHPITAVLLVLLLFAVIAKWAFLNASNWRTSRCQETPSVSKFRGQRPPTINGGDLYYGKAKWPQYEARFNWRLSKLYGPVILINHTPQRFLLRLLQAVNGYLYPELHRSNATILINSLAEDAGTLKRLLDSCASREQSIAAGKYLSRGKRIVLQPHGPEWMRHRKAISWLLTKDKIRKRWSTAVCCEARIMVERLNAIVKNNLYGTGAKLADEIFRFTASSVLQIAYSRRVESPEDPLLKELKTVSASIQDAFTPGKYWVENFPLLDALPSLVSPWKKKLNAAHEFEKGVFGRLFREVERDLTHAKSGPQTDVVIPVDDCAVAQLLRQREHHQLHLDDMVYLAAGLFEAGTETTAMTINTFLLAAACYPEQVTSAQKELEGHMLRKYGSSGGVPSFDELEQLPILSALVKETLRLTPTGASGVGHTPTGNKVLEFELEGQNQEVPTQLRVRPDATVLVNIYGVHHDERLFPDSWRFNLHRWLSSNDTNDDERDNDHHCKPPIAPFAFGFGRRICPGAAHASFSVSMAIAMLILCFDFVLTDRAEALRTDMQRQIDEEHEAFAERFPDHGPPVVDAEIGLRQSDGEQELEGRIGRVLLDAHVSYKLSREQVAECVRLVPRKYGATAVQHDLAGMRG